MTEMKKGKNNMCEMIDISENGGEKNVQRD